ncbi:MULTISPECIES: N-acetyl-gamma-glutamyl-phosphate reductase [Flavobacteriaceae]|uniref:N-acetyl-gamma-glutamyl-phosphate reductase n=2 Tax=Flavobacteriaceae TaxID=49546 RepID=A0A4Y8AT18_9FLAO|nr:MULTISPECIES: N-acetyl-gamma-glutamyl-phosphate reductase [Flavobacteriaceae]TEW74998.1 N-acetyl-gamma-glutamyl-phosphate reductase [Gramella jeungdoensis]GGK42465.1 N-acetyl-gamma-glutamyl-phosphate reductase [Lutibacter litoralis]
MIKVGIVGGAGYTAGELIRLLVNHSQVELDFVYSTSNAGNFIYQVHQDLLGTLDLKFTDTINKNVDVLFLCLGHGNSTAFLENNSFSKSTKVIDLSNDFRLKADAVFQGKEFVYGLPELQKDNIKIANHIANPGCFATSIELALLPLANAGLLNGSVHINATTGATGAGASPGATTHFAWRDNNFSVYKAFTHQHLGEIGESLKALQNNFNNELFFIPNRGNFSRGIFTSIYLKFDERIEKAYQLFEDYYKEAVFTHVSKIPIHLKQVVNTNNCFLHLQKHERMLLITSEIDNLLKGASGQAIQNMNLMLGFEETEGLKLKANSF